MIEIFLRNGEPNSSVRMIDTKDKNPRPMNSGDPHLPDEQRINACDGGASFNTYGNGRGAKMVGHN